MKGKRYVCTAKEKTNYYRRYDGEQHTPILGIYFALILLSLHYTIRKKKDYIVGFKMTVCN